MLIPESHTWRRAGPYPDELGQGVVDEGSAGQEEAAAGAQVMEEEQLLVLEKETRLLSTTGTNRTISEWMIVTA